MQTAESSLDFFNTFFILADGVESTDPAIISIAARWASSPTTWV